MARTYRKTDYASHFRRPATTAQRRQQEQYVDALGEAGLTRFVRPRDKKPVPTAYDDIHVAAYAETPRREESNAHD